MSYLRLLSVLAFAILSGCGPHPESTDVRSAGKVEGPAVKSLSHDQLMAVLHECHRYGSSDDPKVKYTTRYCSAAQSAHAMEGYSTAGSAAVDPTANKLH
jgi:hypothetical protein